MLSPSSTNQFRNPSHAGFGLIELLVTIGIMLLVTTVILVRHTSFNSAILLRNQAYSVAFSIREAQQQAVSVVGQSSQFRQAFGVHLRAQEASFPTFRDVNGNDFYDPGTDAVFGAPGQMDPRFRVREIRTYSGGVESTTQVLSITFIRPNFDARFKTAAAGDLLDAERVEIEIEIADSPARRLIEVTNTGQISVRTP